jgi:hypothetical protein
MIIESGGSYGAFIDGVISQGVGGPVIFPILDN